jgi:hypothetical protein
VADDARSMIEQSDSPQHWSALITDERRRHRVDALFTLFVQTLVPISILMGTEVERHMADALIDHVRKLELLFEAELELRAARRRNAELPPSSSADAVAG